MPAACFGLFNLDRTPRTRQPPGATSTSLDHISSVLDLLRPHLQPAHDLLNPSRTRSFIRWSRILSTFPSRWIHATACERTWKRGEKGKVDQYTLLHPFCSCRPPLPVGDSLSSYFLSPSRSSFSQTPYIPRALTSQLLADQVLALQ
ncbi:unnamed protein product [Cyclocybe aegerita]|uniref:Uncharacterized protein n=1 Tax=Cyclocybe aegerita TaxID=1973307 RepID=A0A8S0VTR1_CYCAE|nr:unnamed protein product [Cyclocybe aegerita]